MTAPQPPACEDCGEPFVRVYGHPRYAKCWAHADCPAAPSRALPSSGPWTAGENNKAIGTSSIKVGSSIKTQGAVLPRHPIVDEPLIDISEEAHEIDGLGGAPVELEVHAPVEPAVLEVLPIQSAELHDASSVEEAAEEPVAIDHDALTCAENRVPEIHESLPSVTPFSDGRSRVRSESIPTGARKTGGAT